MEGIHVLIGEAEIAARVETLAAEIAQRATGDLVLVGLLKGAAIFVADLARALYRAGAHPEIDVSGGGVRADAAAARSAPGPFGNSRSEIGKILPPAPEKSPDCEAASSSSRGKKENVTKP